MESVADIGIPRRADLRLVRGVRPESQPVEITRTGLVGEISLHLDWAKGAGDSWYGLDYLDLPAIRVTWGRVEPLYARGVEVYLTQRLRPYVGARFPLSPAVQVNLPSPS